MSARAPRTLLLVVAVIGVSALVSACGDEDGASGSATAPTTQAPLPATTPTASIPDGSPPAPPTATLPPETERIPGETTPGPPPPSNTTPTEQEREGGGGEQAIRVPVVFVVEGGRLARSTITVPPMLAIELSVTAADGAEHELVLDTPQPQALRLAAGERVARVRIPGLRAGSYDVVLDGKPAGELIVGGEVGP